MARITVEDCLLNIDNRFALVLLAAQRVKQIKDGSEPLVDAPDNKEIVTTLREIAAGKVRSVQDLETITRVSED